MGCDEVLFLCIGGLLSRLPWPLGLQSQLHLQFLLLGVRWIVQTCSDRGPFLILVGEMMVVWVQVVWVQVGRVGVVISHHLVMVVLVQVMIVMVHVVEIVASLRGH